MKTIKLLCFGLLFLPNIAFAQSKSDQACVTGLNATTGGTFQVDTNAYVTGDLVGPQIKWTNILNPNTGTGLVLTAKLVDNAAVAVDFDLVIFTDALLNASIPTDGSGDNHPFAPTDADTLKILTVINFSSTSRFAFSSNGVKIATNQAQTVIARTSGSVSPHLYGALVARGSADFDAAGDVTPVLCVLRD